MSGNATSLDDGVAQRRQLDTLGDCDPFDVFGWDHTMAPQGRPAIQDRYTTLIRITQVHNRGDPQLPSLLALNRARDAFLESWENVVRRTRGRNSNTWNPDAPMDFRALRRPRPSRPATHPTTPTRNRPPPSHYAPLQASTSRSAPTFRVNTGTGGWSSRRSQSPETSHFATRTPRSARVRSPSGHISAGDSDDDVIITKVLKTPSKTKPSRDNQAIVTDQDQEEGEVVIIAENETAEGRVADGHDTRQAHAGNLVMIRFNRHKAMLFQSMEPVPNNASAFRVRQVTYKNVHVVATVTTAIRMAGNIEPTRMSPTRDQLRQYAWEVLEQREADRRQASRGRRRR